MDPLLPDEPDRQEPSLAAELSAIAHEPLLTVEKKLIAGSLLLGVLLLGLLLWISARYFPIEAFQPHDRAGPRTPAPTPASAKAPAPA
jgi:hypothetical protein